LFAVDPRIRNPKGGLQDEIVISRLDLFRRRFFFFTPPDRFPARELTLSSTPAEALPDLEYTESFEMNLDSFEESTEGGMSNVGGSWFREEEATAGEAELEL